MPTPGGRLRSEPGLLRRFARRLRGNKAGLLRRSALLLGWMALLGVVVVTTVWALRIRSGSRIMVGDVFSLATLSLTFFAGVVALLAYQASTGSPDLRLGITFYDDDEKPDVEKPYRYEMYYNTSGERWTKLQAWFESHNDHPNVQLEEDPGGWKKIAYIWIINNSKYSARNPAVIVRFGWNPEPTMGLCKSWKEKDDLPWEVTDSTSSGIVALATQWDGEYPIHGHSTRRLPNLPLASLFSTKLEEPVKFNIELLADGYRKIVPITMNFTVEPARAEQQQAVQQREKRERWLVLLVLIRRHFAESRNNYA
jgi:hypothetical protein